MYPIGSYCLQLYQIMKKEATEWERGWTDLCLKYREWEDMRAKGKMKMKKKTNKDGKQYYDFDFSRYQYYYSYPDDHIGLAAPATQRDFINHILEKSTDNFSQLYLDRGCSTWQQIENMLKPLELHEFLRDINDELTHKITSLRIQKTLRIKKMKGLFGSENQIEKSVVELIESQIRSLVHKQIRIHQRCSQMGNPLSERLKDHKSFLKTRTIDQFQFSDLSKGDMVVLMRVRQVKQALSFNSQIFTRLIHTFHTRSFDRIKSKALEYRAQANSQKKKHSERERMRIMEMVIERVNEKEASHFDNPENKTKLEAMINSLNYMEQFQQNIQETKSARMYSQHFTTVQLNFEEVAYVPLNLPQIKERLVGKLAYYFNKKLVDDEILNSSDQHICYKLNNLCFLQLKVLWQTYNFAHQKEESSLIKIRSMMRKQLELVFSHHVNDLLNIRNHSIKIATNERWIPKLLYNYSPQTQKQSIMAFEISQANRFQDPMTCSLIELLGVNRDIVVREQIEKYVARSIEASSKLYAHRSLYYRNCSADEKMHLINVLSQNVSIKKPEPDPLIKYYFQVAQSLNPSQTIDENVLRSYYMLAFLRCCETRYQLMEVLNGQIMCMIKVQSRIKMLWKKGRIPFQMSKEFIDRFIEPMDSLSQGFNFINSETSQSHVDKLFSQMYNEDADRDFVEWNAEIGIEVRRKKSDNPLLQGKSVIYSQTYEHLEQCMTRIQFLCSQSIKRRQIYLPDAQLTQIVDRLELLFEFLTLEHDFQRSKLKLLDRYTEQLLFLTAPDGITMIYQEMSKIMHFNNVVDLTQAHFQECYLSETDSLEAKSKILKSLSEKQNRFQKQHIRKTFEEYRQVNLGSSIPEISSIYYTEEIAAQEHSIIEQAAEDQNESVSDTESELLGKNTISEISSVVDGGHYQLKTSFQEVLSKNSVQGIKEGNNKKDEIMNKKKQKIINDTILGALIPRTASLLGHDTRTDEFYCYSYFAVEIMRHIDGLLSDCYFYPNNRAKAIFLSELQRLVEDFTFEEFKPLIRPEQLTLCFNSAHKALNKFMEKAKSQGSISSRSSNEHWLCIGSKVMEGIISGQTGCQIDEMRGLYVGLNAFHINELHFYSKQIENIEKSPFSQYWHYQNLMNDYCGHKVESKYFQLQSFNYFEKREVCFYKLRETSRQSGDHWQLSIGNYAQYMRATISFDIATHHLLSAYNAMMHKMLENLLSLEQEISIMEKYQCCYKLFPILHAIPNIQNRVNLRKRLDFINVYKKSALPKYVATDLIEAMELCTTSIPKFRKVEAKMSLNSMASLAYEFEKYISESAKSALLLNMLAEELKAQVQARSQIYQLKQLSGLMPLIDKHLLIRTPQNLALLNVFNQYREILETRDEKEKKDVKLTIAEEKLSLKKLLDYVLAASETAMRWVKQECATRKKNQISLDPKKVQFSLHISRHLDMTQGDRSSRLQQKLSPFLKDNQKCNRIVMLRQWIQMQLLIFGCNLSPAELVKYRKMLCNSTVSFPIFWEDNTKHLINNRQLSRLKNSSLEAQQIVNNYKSQYLTYAHLKKAYRNFIQDLSEYEFQQEPSDTFLVLYIGAPSYFNQFQQDWGFLSKFCDPFSQDPQTQLDLFCGYLKKSTIQFKDYKSRLSGSVSRQWYNLDKLKYALWNSPGKQTIRRTDASRRFIKQRLNENKSLALKPISDEIALSYYRTERLQQMLLFLGIEISEYKLQLQSFKENFDKYIHEGLVVLNPKQMFLFNMTEKNIEAKGQLIKSKDEIMKVVITNQFYMKLIREKFYSFCSKILENELSLRKILLQDLYNEEVSRDQRILKQTINKILVPKVKLNPFLASPLRVQNYFFAGTIKMSFIDQFLNKLRNRAVLIELAEGGTGYLLKVNELDESVDVLCKSILGFSEKEFSDRFRTVFESLEETKQRNAKLEEENKNLRAILNALKGYEGKEIKSLLYQKLNDYLVAFYEHQKTYTVMVNLLKSVENKIENELNNKFYAVIKSLENENNQLRGALRKINSDNSQAIKTCANEVRDLLYSGFKNKAEDILNKKFIQDIEEDAKFENIEAQDSNTLIKKLKMQKSFYELKIAKVEGKYQEKIKNLEKKLLEQSKLQNLLLMEQEKNKGLTKQIKQLQKCSIQNELLKKEMSKKEEEETMQKFRLVKVNESLKGKIKRMEGEMEAEKTGLQAKIQTMIKVEEKSRSTFSVQVNELENNKIKRKSIHTKTESSAGSHIFDVGLWKQKWLKSERRCQQLVEGIRKSYEHFIFTKNGSKLTENLRLLLVTYQNRKAELKTKNIGSQTME